MIRIGARPATASGDLVALLLDCHERIRSFTALAVELAAAASPDPASVADAAGRVRRYFAEALPLHARDEEESILPRLQAREAGLDEALFAMHEEHAEHGPLVDRLVALCAGLEREPGRLAELAPPLASTAAELRAHFDVHLEREERVVFPALAGLPEEERAAIVRELRARRA